MSRRTTKPKNPCCGKLFFAEMISGLVVLECCTCGKLWRKHVDGSLVALERRDKSRIHLRAPVEPARRALRVVV